MTESVTFAQLCGSLESLLLLWAGIERQARVEVAKAYDGCVPKSAHGIAAVLDSWEAGVFVKAEPGSLRRALACTLRTQLYAPLQMRNGLCHGLIGISCANDKTPASLMWEINGATQSIGWDELQTVFRWLSKVAFAMDIISNSSAQKPGNRLTDSAENRAWWLDEFGIAIPPRAVADGD